MRTDSFRSSSLGIGRKAMALLVGLSGLLPAASTSLAHEASSEATISIAVLPAEFTPSSQSGGTIASSSDAQRPGTVSTRFVGVHGNELTDRADDMVMTIIIGDDRGTAAGWDMKSSFASQPGTDGVPILIEGCERTIFRLLPVSDGKQEESSQIQGGGTLGHFASPITLLRASPGSGSGVYLQQVIMVMPDNDDDEAFGTMIVHLTSAP